MKKINLFLFAFLLIFAACDDQEQIYDQLKGNPTIPVLTIEGASQIAIMEDYTPEMFSSVLTWTKAYYGKDVIVSYTLEMSGSEDFDANVETTEIGNDVYMHSLSYAQLVSWAKDKYKGNEEDNGEANPVKIYFRITAKVSSENTKEITDKVLTSNATFISVYWYKEPWEPVEITIGFKAVSGDWGEYAVYAWGDEEVFGSWPGTVLKPNKDGWYSFVIPVNRPVNLIINNNKSGDEQRQFDFLKDPIESECYEFKIGDGNNNCTWTAVDCPDLSIYPSTMYMIGDEFGSWDWNSDGIGVMTPVWGTEGQFWCVRYISAGKGFKWCSVRDWNGDFFSLGQDIGYTTSGGNAFVAEDGMYMIYMDMPNGKISVEPAKVFGMGDCFGGWDMGAHPFTVENKTMTFTTTGTGELRIYANSDISSIGGDWWKMEFVVLDGKIAYRGSGDDQQRATVEAGKKVTLDFNAGTGTIE